MAQGVPILRFLNNSGQVLLGLDIYDMANGQLVASRNNIPHRQTVDFSALELRGGVRFRLVAHTLALATLDNVRGNATVELDPDEELVVIH
jgi:hypothetical protein